MARNEVLSALYGIPVSVHEIQGQLVPLLRVVAVPMGAGRTAAPV
ncbi:hypothetical protein [Comamonas terrigena]|nr:hypothetical protein [Comamonas terrigena]MDH1701352.1 hypothetical protein [Comamonas terrigena]